MSRLIDADRLIKELKGCICTDKHDERIIKEFVVHAVDKQPTAFDVNMVIEILQGASYMAECIGYETRYVNLAKAIEVVKRGGVDEIKN